MKEIEARRGSFTVNVRILNKRTSYLVGYGRKKTTFNHELRSLKNELIRKSIIVKKGEHHFQES